MFGLLFPKTFNENIPGTKYFFLTSFRVPASPWRVRLKRKGWNLEAGFCSLLHETAMKAGQLSILFFSSESLRTSSFLFIPRPKIERKSGWMNWCDHLAQPRCEPIVFTRSVNIDIEADGETPVNKSGLYFYNTMATIVGWNSTVSPSQRRLVVMVGTGA